MTDDPKLLLDRALSLIDRIEIELLKVRRRSEQKMISDELLLFTESVRRKAQEMEMREYFYLISANEYDCAITVHIRVLELCSKVVYDER